MTEAKRSLKVFLCHAHSDKEAVKSLYDRLTQDGVDVWLDKEKLLPGADWEMEIRKAVREADVVVVCLSKQFNQVGFRLKEVRLALDTAMEKPEGEIFIIPARLEECDTLESLRKWHWVDLFDESGYRRLMLACNEKAKHTGIAFELPKQHSEVMPSDVLFIKKVAEELGKPSFLEKLITAISRFVRYLPNMLAIVFGVGFGITIIIATISLDTIKNWFFPVPTATPIAIRFATSTPSFSPVLVETFTLTETVIPTFTATSTQTSTPTLTPTFTPTLTQTPFVILDHGTSMVFVPAGFFQMQSEQGLVKTYVNSFYIDQHEVTNAQYEECVKAKICSMPDSPGTEFANVKHYGNPPYNEFPVVLVRWQQAENYCIWRGGNARLPTAAEWEKAARGNLPNQSYPWGNTPPVCKEGSLNGANFLECNSIDAFPVMQFAPNGYGLYDMSGNVGEWISDLDVLNKQYFIRGGSWLSNSNQIKVESMSKGGRIQSFVDTGFRCAKDANP